MDLLSPHGQELARHMGITLSAVPSTPEPPPLPPKKSYTVMRGLSRLTNLTNSVIAQMDAVADQTATEIQQSADRIKAAMDGFTQVNVQMKQTAAEAEAVLKTLTNGLPSDAPPSPTPQPSNG